MLASMLPGNDATQNGLPTQSLQPETIFPKFVEQVFTSIIAPALDSQLQSALVVVRSADTESSGFVSHISQQPGAASNQAASGSKTKSPTSTKIADSSAEGSNQAKTDQVDGSEASSSYVASPESNKARELMALIQRFGVTQKDLHTEEYKVKRRDIVGMIEKRQGIARRTQAACEWMSPKLQQESQMQGASALSDLREQVNYGCRFRVPEFSICSLQSGIHNPQFKYLMFHLDFCCISCSCNQSVQIP